MKNFIRFLDAEFNADFKNFIFFVFGHFLIVKKFSSNVDQNS